MAFVIPRNDYPAKQFLSKDYQNTLSSSLSTVDGRRLHSVVSFQFEEAAAPFGYVNVYRLVNNGKMLLMYAKRDSEHDDYENEEIPNFECVLFTYYKKGLSKRCSRSFPFNRTYEDYVMSPRFTYIMLIEKSLLEAKCSLSCLTCDQTVYRETSKGKLLENLYEIHCTDKILFTPVSSFSSDGNFYCFVSNGLLRSSDINKTRFCCIDMFICKTDGKYVSLEHLFNEDISDSVSSYGEVISCMLNNIADKLFLEYRDHYVIYSVKLHRVIANGQQGFSHVQWVNDYNHGEMLIEVHTTTFGITIYKLDVSQQCLYAYRTFSVADYFPGYFPLFSKCAFTVSTGIVRLFFAVTESVYVFDPFNMICTCQLSLPSGQYYVVDKILVNWPGNEVVVIEKKKANLNELLSPRLTVFMLGWREDFTLKFISAVNVLRNFSKDWLRKLNLPKSIKIYLNLQESLR